MLDDEAITAMAVAIAQQQAATIARSMGEVLRAHSSITTAVVTGLGAFIGAEATLAFLGIGLRPPVVSWGVMISESRDYFQAAPHMLLFPAGFVTITVLAFVILGDAVRDALDPKSR